MVGHRVVADALIQDEKSFSTSQVTGARKVYPMEQDAQLEHLAELRRRYNSILAQRQVITSVRLLDYCPGTFRYRKTARSSGGRSLSLRWPKL